MIVELILNGFTAVSLVAATGSITLMGMMKKSTPAQFKLRTNERRVSTESYFGEERRVVGYDRRERNIELASKIRTIIQTDPNTSRSVKA